MDLVSSALQAFGFRALRFGALGLDVRAEGKTVVGICLERKIRLRLSIINALKL